MPEDPTDPSKTADQQPGAAPPATRPPHGAEEGQSDEGGDSDVTPTKEGS